MKKLIIFLSEVPEYGARLEHNEVMVAGVDDGGYPSVWI